MPIPQMLKGAEYERPRPEICVQCGQQFTATDSLETADFCSFQCEHLWAEEHGGYAIRKRGRFPRIGYIDGEFFTFPANPLTLVERVQHYPIDVFTYLQHPAVSGVAYGYPCESETLAMVQLSTFDHWWKKQAQYSVRKQVNKAERSGVQLQEEQLTEELLKAIHQIYDEVPIRQGRRFPHYKKSIERVREMTSTFPDRSTFLTARWNGQIIGFIKLVMQGDYATILHILSLVAHRDKSPTNALLACAVRTCCDRHISLLSYGRFNYGKKGHDGLQEFKITHGFECVTIPRFYVPLTFRGQLALRLGLHRPLRERIPGNIARAFLDVRSKWYAAVVQR
jgi:Acetyltransferase (GNAT) domain